MAGGGNFFTLNTGARIPAVGLGTWEIDGAPCKAAVAAALEVGYRHFDCAHLYGNEREVGKVLAGALRSGLLRDDVFVTSKFWCTTGSAKHVDRAVETSLTNLGVAHLDLFLVHWPVMPSVVDATDPPPRQHADEAAAKPWRLEATWRAMENLVDKGLARAIGVSNFSGAQVAEILRFAKIVPAVHQMELHPFWRQDELVKFCQSHGIHVSAHMPLGIPGKDASPGEPEAGEKPGPAATLPKSTSVHAPMLRTSVVAEIAKKLGRTPGQVILRWGVQRGTSVLPRSLLVERIKANFDILNWSLSDEDWTKINTIEPQLRLIDGAHSLPGHGPLQSVVETDDPIDETGYESDNIEEGEEVGVTEKPFEDVVEVGDTEKPVDVDSDTPL